MQDWQIISICVNIAIFLLVILLSYILIRKLNFEQKGYKHLFVLYTIFWIPLMLLRAVTGTFENNALNDSAYLWIPLAAYGFIGIFARIFADLLGYRTKSRKSFIYFAVIVQIVTYIPIIIWPCTTTNVIQSLGVGVGASAIGTYQLLFNEQYGKSRQFLTVSILSIPPLLADFISSPIQSLVVSFCTSPSDTGEVIWDKNIMKYFWLIGLGFVLICLVMSYFVKEDRGLFQKDVQYKEKIQSKNEWIYYVLICLIGSLIAFIKFANSGAIAQLHIQQLANFYGEQKDLVKTYYGYLSVIFSLGQLIGGLLTGLVLVKRIGKIYTVLIGSIVWIIYHILALYVVNPYGYLAVHVLNGFAYGIIYNLILGFVLMRTFNTKKITPMGVYQAVLSIGITFSNFFTSWLKKDVLSSDDKTAYFNAADTINYIIIGTLIFTWLIFSYTCFIEKWDYKRLWFKKEDFVKKSI